MKSLVSMETKVNYIARDLNRQLKQEKCFPLVLNLNYNEVIKPRGDLIKDSHFRFNLVDAFFCTDNEFCKKYNVDKADLNKAK